jgi:hypothetical protein
MYNGANGYFKTALADRRFELQQKTSFFSINYGDWVIVGLDSAYNATHMFMDGALNDQYQPGFLAEQFKTAPKSLLLTHHNPMNFQGTSLDEGTLWNDVATALGGKHPTAWYWGHVHNGVVYNQNAPTGSILARCLGNAAIPIGNSWQLENQNNELGSKSPVEYYTNTPLGINWFRYKLLVQNGFAILELTPEGGMVETWYNQDGSVAWTKTS